MLSVNIKNEEGTKEVAHKIAVILEPNDTVLLYGDLGAGKTAFTRYLINALSEKAEEVPSPTFTLVQTYPTPKGDIWHFDLYRIEHPEEIYELGWEEAQATGITIVEWPERLGGFLPDDRLEIVINNVKDQENERQVSFKEVGSWNGRLSILGIENGTE